ncbi:hypothetical protein SteCoe_4219 [Stentor coeruleus]|uniref:Uncharacterized protein n=1 Tax=Stentor coeruleus TaxID=5963 RepID=A0A1R2CV43_9CILI|nr:hypothetical protein SteCoe_4219 [Stentor coeruleus]
MESFKQGFSIFLDLGDPEAFLSLGNDGLDNLSQISQYEFSRITKRHLLALIKSLFPKETNINASKPYFAGQLLAHIASTTPEKFFDKEILKESLGFLDYYEINPTSCGYFYQFLKPIISRKNGVLKEFFLDSKSIEVLTQNLMSSSIAQLTKDLIINYYETCDDLLNSLLNFVTGRCEDTARVCTEIIVDLIPKVNPSLLNRVFTISCLGKLVFKDQKQGKYPLMVLCEILKLQRETQATQLGIKIIADNIQTLCDLLGSKTTNETKIIIINAVGLATKSNFGVIQLVVAQSSFIRLCTEIFFANFWNSILHCVCYQTILTILSSESNLLLLAFFDARFIEKMLEQSENPEVLYKKSLFRKGFMGFLTKIGCELRDSRSKVIKNYVKELPGWEKFLAYVSNQEFIENSVLGGRTRYRHLTSDDIKFLNSINPNETPNNDELYQDFNFWSLPILEIDL